VTETDPFRPVTVEPRWLAWNGGAVRGLARDSAERRAFHRLPALAAALEQAGCRDAAVLGHRRRAGEHPPACWVLGLLTGTR
jgi:hypothetical protein